MDNNINANVLKNFIVRTIGADKLAQNQAKKFGVDAEKFADETVNKDQNMYLELDEILQDDDLYAQFATMFVEETEANEDANNEEKEKEEAMKVQDRNGAGTA